MQLSYLFFSGIVITVVYLLSYCYVYLRLSLCCRIDECSARKMLLIAVREYIVIYIVTYMDPQFSTLLPTVKALVRRLTAVGSYVAIPHE